MTTIGIQLIGERSDEELRSLHAWLIKDSYLRQNAEVKLVPQQTRPGTMGDALDLISLLVTSGLQLPSFISTLMTWRSTRPRKSSIVIKKGDTTMTITDTDQETALKLFQALLEKQ
ncbi:hypothetical protein HCN51_30265 [Nonomuraea sp. FMUSA5-5]|uniref:Uncharacterized protein n=1 Tax=Nonomuraea composti TaxID=2720023 RepID=A0ABX1BEX8_9ACTN|nr:hypothetical protein [Nonomuraea sp. FMUSA5-5]NJP93678.1 hypothetical protein [Nonomuraea sp. FMUSA5-5]